MVQLQASRHYQNTLVYCFSGCDITCFGGVYQWQALDRILQHLKKLLPGDVVLDDRGFNIGDSVEYIPAFTN